MASEIDPTIRVQPIQRLPSPLSTNFKTKDPIPNELQSNLIYRINCSECDASCIGKTIRHGSQRILEHRRVTDKIQPMKTTPITTDSNLRRSDRIKNSRKQHQPPTSDPTTQNIKSAITKHVIDTQHEIDWVKWSVLTREKQEIPTISEGIDPYPTRQSIIE